MDQKYMDQETAGIHEQEHMDQETAGGFGGCLACPCLALLWGWSVPCVWLGTKAGPCCGTAVTLAVSPDCAVQAGSGSLGRRSLQGELPAPSVK